uniref:DDE_Tnp_1_7 domain-containing protein n=1 Tax=Strongyloides stercoralis TaxID=6248 RepID=A0A0K0EMX6_STRER
MIILLIVVDVHIDTIYLENETAVQPNCSVQRTIFGYLDSVTVDGVATKLNDLPTDGASMNNLKLVEAFTLVVADITEDRVTLDCFYVTINGNVTLVQTFLKGKKSLLDSTTRERKFML